MDFSALMTSAGINIGLCALFLSLYSVLRKQPTNVYVYFGRRIAQEHTRETDCFSLDRLMPSPSWIFKAWENTECDILQCGGLDSVVFLRFLVFRFVCVLFCFSLDVSSALFFYIYCGGRS
jgi:calcium permeable stress-gated cation channel